MKIQNLESPRTGRPVVNQFEIFHDGVTYFQSYSSICAKYEDGVLTLGRDWDYSITTLKYLYEWLGANCSSIARQLWNSSNKRKELQYMIDAGIVLYDETLI